jgi:ABC-type Zn uptake system ZnuABC Zn-binding protein ZnuA
MLTGIKYIWTFSIVVVLLLVAAQCGAQPAPEAPPAKVEPAAETQVQEQATAEDNAEAHDMDEHAHEAEEHADEDDHEEEHKHETESAELTSVPLADGEKLKVVATTSIVADIVRQVGGDMIDLTLLLPIGTDPHTFQPAPQDLVGVADAHLVVANGMGLEEFLDEMIENAGGEVAVVHVSHGIETRAFGEEEAHEHEGEDHEHEGDAPEDDDEAHEHEREETHHHHEGADPHTWTTPANAVHFVHNIEHALGSLDPANSEAYEINAEAYEAELEELDEWVKGQIATIPAENRELVTDHTVFGYYADRYGLEQIGAVIPSTSTAAEPSAKELADLEDAIRAYEVKAMFVGNSVNPSLSKQVAEDTGTKLLTLYTGSLGTEGSGVETYVDYIKYNTNTIVEGLN